MTKVTSEQEEETMNSQNSGIAGLRPSQTKSIKLCGPDRIQVLRPKILKVDSLPAERLPLGKQGDYKPCIARLPSGELLVVAFDSLKKVHGRLQEDMLLWRSTDGGRAWSERQVLGLLGREPYFSVMRDRTLFITTHLLEQDIRNKDDYLSCYLHRSADEGRTWQTLKIDWRDVPGASPKAEVGTSRNLLELEDGSLVWGVCATGGLDYLWRSSDRGFTWDKSLRCEFTGIDKAKLWWGLLAETVFWQARSKDLLALIRADQKVLHPIPGTRIPDTKSDHFERLVVGRSKNRGLDWALEELGSYYGEMYPSILRLRDGRLLLTFTVRSAVEPQQPPLGVHAVLGIEEEDGFRFAFEHDRFVLDAKTPIGQASGGGFGPTVQLDDGTLVTSYSYAGPGEWGTDFHCEVVRWRLSEDAEDDAVSMV
ncbi:MAG: exo-alpha-sialidase [Planctomycetes bacterium]|nr:exo-alpha-sialidase [Planctomycetota bacterium]